MNPGLISRSLAALGLMALLACKKDEVGTYTAPKEGAPAPQAAPPAMGGMGMPGPAGMAGEVPPPPAPSAEGALKWTLPKDWTEQAGSGMRYATLKPAAAGLEVSVIMLGGNAGGELANVNRWRGQIGLGAVDEAGMAKLRTLVKSKAGEVSVVDFTGEGQTRTRMVAAQLGTPDGNTWFLKLTGEAGAVGKLRPEFIRLIESLRVGK